MPTDGVRIGLCDEPLMPRSQQSFCPILAVKLLGVMVRNRCRPTTFHTVTTGDALVGVRIGWCDQPLRLSTMTISKPCEVCVCEGVNCFYFHVLWHLPIWFTQQNLWCISKSTMDHQQKSDSESDLPCFSYGYRKCMFIGFFLSKNIPPPNCVHYWAWSN